MKGRLINKIHSNSGETITEVLVAALVVVLGAVLLATMVTASFRMIRNSQKAYDNYLSVQDALAKRDSASANGSTEMATYQAVDGEADINGDDITGSIGVTIDEVTPPGDSNKIIYSYRAKE